MNNLHIRPVMVEDLDKLAELYVQVYTAFDVGEKWEISSAKAMLGYWIKHHPDLAYLAEVKGVIVGAFLVGVKPWNNGNKLFDGELFVHPEFQKKGIGSELLKKVFTVAKEKYKVTDWYTITFKNFKHPLGWYKKLGFKETNDYTIIGGNIDEATIKLK